MDRMNARLPNASSRLIAMAANLVGSRQEVMARMKCRQPEFDDYCAGRKEPPAAQLERLVMLIVNEQQGRMDKNRAFLRAARRKPRT